MACESCKWSRSARELGRGQQIGRLRPGSPSSLWTWITLADWPRGNSFRGKPLPQKSEYSTSVPGLRLRRATADGPRIEAVP